MQCVVFIESTNDFYCEACATQFCVEVIGSTFQYAKAQFFLYEFITSKLILCYLYPIFRCFIHLPLYYAIHPIN